MRKRRRKPNFRHRAAVREKRRARAFWRLREQCRQETEREFAPPPMPKWMFYGYMALAGGLVGLAVYLVGKLFV